MKQERAYGIDLLRILATMMVLILHVFSNGGVLYQLVPDTANYYVGWFLEAMCFCAVDIFAILTGYLMVDKEVALWKFVARWLQVWVISAGLMVFYDILSGGASLSVKERMTYLFPVTYNHWKYFTGYCLVVLFMPLINLGIQHMSQQQHRFALLLLFGISVWTTGCFSDPFNLLSGYSAFWIMLLYIMGALIQKTGLVERVSPTVALVGYFFCVCLAYASKVIEVLLGGRLLRLTQGTGFLMNYVSPAVLLCAIFLLIFFSHVENVPAKTIPFICWLSKVSFGVFLLHSHHVIRSRYYPDLFADMHSLGTFNFIMQVFGSSMIVYLLCGIIEHCRQILFDRCGIERRIRNVCEKIQNVFLQGIDTFFAAD